jgi:NADPH2:quinone reductase
MANAIRVHAYGGPEALTWESIDVPEPGPGEAKIRHSHIGLNFIDVYHRNGLYKQPQLPFVPGSEGAGEVIAVGPGVTEVEPGNRVAYAGAIGAYADERLIPAAKLVKLPAGIDSKTAAAMLLQGMTVQYLLRRTFRVGQETTMLLHAAAGGIGLIASQWGKHLGATVIGTVGSEEKAELARNAGCAHVINVRTENFVERVKEITGGKGVDVVYDGVGKDTFPASLDCIRPLGMWVSFGNASGAVPPFDILLLSQKGSLFATRPTLHSYTATRADLLATAQDLFDVVEKGHVKIAVNQTYALKNAADAHRDLEARKTTGSTVLLPDRVIRPTPARESS